MDKGKYILSPLAVNIYKAPGDVLIRTATPNGYVGKVERTNDAGTWILLTNGYWVIADKSYQYNDHLTQFQLDDYAAKISSKPREQSEAVRKEIENKTSFSSTFPSIDLFSGKVQILLVIIFAVVLLAVFLRIKG